jgi:hypothetical protein
MSQNYPARVRAQYDRDEARRVRPLQTQAATTLAPRLPTSPPATQVISQPSGGTRPGGGTSPVRTAKEVNKANASCRACEYQSRVYGVAPWCYNPVPTALTCQRWTHVDAPAVPQPSQSPYTSSSHTQPGAAMQTYGNAGDSRLYSPSAGSFPSDSLFQVRQGARPLAGLSQSPPNEDDESLIVKLSGEKWKQSWTEVQTPRNSTKGGQSSGGNGT